MDQYNNYIGLTLDGRYTIKKLVGYGGMAMVFEADDLLRNAVVAVKILKEEFASDEVSVQRFINESKAVLMLSHTNIVKIFDVSVKGEHKYIVMEYIDGITLKSYIERKGALSVKETISYSIQILRALEHAHIGGVIHRDIKPQNIMLLKNGQIKVTDFGIAKLPDAKTLTATDKAIGTVYYISPEQAAGEKGIDRRTDLYSVGVMMYEMLTGKLPFDGENPVSIALKQINEQPKAPTEVLDTIPKGLEQIILFAMEKDKEKRFQTATQMIELLQKVRENPLVVFRQRSTTEKKSKKKNKATMTPIIIGVVSAFLLVCVISAIVVIKDIFFSEEAQTDNTVKVKNYVGEFYDDVEEDINDTFLVVTRRFVESNNDNKGIILKQIPAAGEVQKTAEIIIEIGEGIVEVDIKDYANQTKNFVESDLRNCGLSCDYENAKYEASSTILEGRVIRTIPAAGERVTKGTKVLLVLSSGTATPVSLASTMPNLVGLNTVEAYGVLQNDGLRFAGAKYEYSDEYASGVIIDQSPADGATVTKGVSKVTLTISKGPKPKTISVVPLIEGHNQGDAEKRLRENDLNIGNVEYEYSDEIDAGIVISQSVAEGSEVPIYGSISFVVSRGPAPYIPEETEPIPEETEPVPEETEPVPEETEPTPEETEPLPEETTPAETTAATTKPKDPFAGRFN